MQEAYKKMHDALVATGRPFVYSLASTATRASGPGGHRSAPIPAVDKDPAGNQGYRIWQEGPHEIWMKVMSDRSRVVGLFNRGYTASQMTVNFHQIGVDDTGQVRDLWARKDLGARNDSFTAKVPRHGVVLVRISDN